MKAQDKISKSKNNNHFVSRFQLRRFLCDPPKNKPGRYFVWVYSGDEEPQAKNIQNVGSAIKFYGESDDDLENAFSDRESVYGGVFSALERLPDDVTKYADQLSDLCWLFSFRTRALREKLKLGITSTVDRVAGSVTAGRLHKRFSTQIDARLLKIFDEKMIGLNRKQKAAMRRQPEFQKSLLVAKHQANEFLRSEEFASHFRRILTSFGLAARETPALDNEHNRVLTDMIATGERCPEKLRPKRWYPMVSPDGLFVLGDSGAILANNSGEFSPFIGMGSNADCLFLPINPHVTAVGIFSENCRIWTEEDIVKGTVSSSFENFFANRYDQKLRTLAGVHLLRQNIVTDAQIDEIVNGFWQSK
ncbi:DUF4238 domain-containing protein [Mesorhizobium sp. ASY16-5R]|uniref:DUF4238 domain-containing protein n=1 Tax=Mesorhizobium sp. ASY16-5R TaxID=3445772 RepID=UPI003FA0C51F